MEIISNNKTEVNTSVVEFKSNAEEFENAIQKVYFEKRKNVSIPGFRKGKASRKMMESQFGESVFYEDAVSKMYPQLVSDAVKELELNVISMSEIDVTDVSKTEGVTFKATFITKPEVEISDYLGLEVSKNERIVSGEDINAELEKLQDKNARIVDVYDRPTKMGDTIIFDFTGMLNGEPFNGGAAKDFSLELGSHKFIPGFEEQLVDRNINEDFKVNIKFPDDYSEPTLASQDTVFDCKIASIKGKELSELDDEFVKDVSEFNTMDELKEDIKTKLTAQYEKETKTKIDNDVSLKIVEKLVGEIPQVMYDKHVDDMVKDWENRNSQYGITLEKYLEYAHITEEAFRKNFEEPAQIQVKLRLALEKISKLENIEVDDETVEKEYQSIADEHKMDVNKVKSILSADSIRLDAVLDKTFNFIKENIKFVD